MIDTMPAGIRSFDPMPYGYRRWNGAVWIDAWVDIYNNQLDHIKTMHEAGYDTQSLIDGLYRNAQGWDYS